MFAPDPWYFSAPSSFPYFILRVPPQQIFDFVINQAQYRTPQSHQKLPFTVFVVFDLRTVRLKVQHPEYSHVLDHPCEHSRFLLPDLFSCLDAPGKLIDRAHDQPIIIAEKDIAGIPLKITQQQSLAQMISPCNQQRRKVAGLENEEWEMFIVNAKRQRIRIVLGPLAI